MFRLLAIEWLKIRHYRTFWVLMILFAALLLLVNYAVSHHFFVHSNVDLNLFTKGYSFPDVWANVGFWVRILGGLIPVFIIISTTNEFQFRTHRQNVIDGWSRAQFFHAKWLLCGLVALFITALSVALGLGFGYYYSKGFAAAGEHWESLGSVFLLVLNYTAFAMTLSFFIKRAALTIILFVSFTYIIEFVIAHLLSHYAGHAMGEFMPLQSSAGLLPFPLTELVRKQVVTSGGPSLTALACASAGWLAFYYLIGLWKMQRSDW